MNKLSGSHTNLAYLKNKFGSCLGLKGNNENEAYLNLKFDYGKLIGEYYENNYTFLY
jgi:hypothetical protein